MVDGAARQGRRRPQQERGSRGLETPPGGVGMAAEAREVVHGAGEDADGVAPGPPPPNGSGFIVPMGGNGAGMTIIDVPRSK